MDAFRKAKLLACAILLGIIISHECGPAVAQTLDSQREALIALYHATDGDNWTNNSNWLTGGDIVSWYGVNSVDRDFVVAIDLSDNSLSGEIPIEIGNLVRIQNLDLSGNNLTGTIPFAFGNLQSLRTLNLQNNSELAGALPLYFHTFGRLNQLWFDGTNLCESAYGPFQEWISAVSSVQRSGCIEPFDESLIGTCELPLGEQQLDANNVRARIVNNGGLFYRGEPHLYEIPIHSGSNAIFAGALWIGGLIDGDLRLSAARYGNREMWAGPLDDNAYPPADCTVYDRIYKISASDVQAYEQMGVPSTDLRDWPTGLGAPTFDADGNQIQLMQLPLSVREDRVINLSEGERPKISGDQTLWWVMNDRGNIHKSTDTIPMGIEIHAQAFAQQLGGVVSDNTTLYSYRIFNRNDIPIEETYIGLFLDTDLGDFDDDYIGSDSTLGMGFTYNQDNVDGGGEGYGTPPPALGVLMVGAPIADNDRVDNDHDGIVDEPGEELRTTTVGSFYGGGGIAGEPTTGIHYYTFMQGYWKDRQPYTLGGNGRDFSGIPTHYFFSGDPVTQEFWSEMNSDGLGTPISPSDRRWFISSGPFTIGAHEDEEFTFAIVWAKGKDHLDSVTELKKVADRVRDAFEQGGWTSSVSLPEYSESPPPNLAAALAENFPEPFSEQTTIQYRLPESADVRLIVFDVLGRENSVLVDERQTAGVHSVEFSGSQLPSGVYFYRIEIDHASATHSMMLVK